MRCIVYYNSQRIIEKFPYQCIPLNEKSSASNRDTISIEVCHPTDSGKFTEEAYQSPVALTAWLWETCGLGSDDILSHYDITGKQCPLYFITHEDAWQQFKANVAKSKIATIR